MNDNIINMTVVCFFIVIFLLLVWTFTLAQREQMNAQYLDCIKSFDNIEVCDYFKR